MSFVTIALITTLALNDPYPACAKETVNIRAGVQINLKTTSPYETIADYPPLERPVIGVIPAGSCGIVAKNKANGVWADGFQWINVKYRGLDGWAAQEFFYQESEIDF